MAFNFDGITPSEAEDMRQIECNKMIQKAVGRSVVVFDGQISMQELVPIVKAMGRKASEDKLQQIMKKADVSGTGTLSYDEYVKFIKDNTVDISLLKMQLREAFMKYDKTRTGDLNINEMKQALASVGHPLLEKEIRELMEQADSNQDGKIDVDEFVELLCKKV